MTLKELHKKEQTPFIAIYTGNNTVYPEYADELLETHGNKKVTDYGIKDNILIVCL